MRTNHDGISVTHLNCKWLNLKLKCGGWIHGSYLPTVSSNGSLSDAVMGMGSLFYLFCSLAFKGMWNTVRKHPDVTSDPHKQKTDIRTDPWTDTCATQTSVVSSFLRYSHNVTSASQGMCMCNVAQPPFILLYWWTRDANNYVMPHVEVLLETIGLIWIVK